MYPSPMARPQRRAKCTRPQWRQWRAFPVVGAWGFALCYYTEVMVLEGIVFNGKEHVLGPLQIAIFVVWAISALALIALILMHSGKGTGVSDMIASSLYTSNSASGVMEKNLDRLTVIAGVVFAVCVVLAMFFFPQGIVGI